MKASTKRMLSILLAILFLIGAVFIYSYLIKPAYGEVLNLRTKKLTLSQTFNNYDSLNKKFKDLFAGYQNLGDLNKQLSMILPSKFDAAYVSGQISGLAEQNGLILQALNIKQLAIKPAKMKFAKGLGILKVDAKLSGSYENFKTFLNGIETNIMISDINNFKIENQAGAQNLIFTVSINAYYQAE